MYHIQDQNEAMDSIFTVLQKYNHPFSMVGQAAHRWMGCAGCIDDAIDLLLRDEQACDIAADLLQSGRWIVLQAAKKNATTASESAKQDAGSFLNHSSDADVVLTPEGKHSGLAFNHVRLWSEANFHLKVDADTWFEVPAIFCGQALLADERFDPSVIMNDKTLPGPALLTRLNDQLFTAGGSSRQSVFIPSIPSYLDALIYHTTRDAACKPQLAFVSSWQIRNLTRYLYLEQPECRLHILFEVEAETEHFLNNYLDKYKRKPRYILSKDEEVILADI